ncbi:SIMPL domain-containing protein [Lysinibacillus sp. FSL K6-0232]|uniref:SIMPL domain-containing protein n=1 Tax=unclassified Lysinibacillus TaxID=2636778 RepID=UPI0030F84A95
MYYVQTQQPSRVITVTGNGQVMAAPTSSQLQIEVQTRGKNVQQPQQDNATIMRQVIQALVALGVPREDIQTATYTITPLYNYEDGQQIFNGYEVINAIIVNTSDLDNIGFIIDTAIENGANRIANIQFNVNQMDAYYQQALTLALHDAQIKAKTIADTMRIALPPLPIEITEEQANTPILYRSMADSSGFTPIEQGQIPVHATVRVKFQY